MEIDHLVQPQFYEMSIPTFIIPSEVEISEINESTPCNDHFTLSVDDLSDSSISSDEEDQDYKPSSVGRKSLRQRMPILPFQIPLKTRASPTITVKPRMSLKMIRHSKATKADPGRSPHFNAVNARNYRRRRRIRQDVLEEIKRIENMIETKLVIVDPMAWQNKQLKELAIRDTLFTNKNCSQSDILKELVRKKAIELDRARRCL